MIRVRLIRSGRRVWAAPRPTRPGMPVQELVPVDPWFGSLPGRKRAFHDLACSISPDMRCGCMARQPSHFAACISTQGAMGRRNRLVTWVTV